MRQESDCRLIGSSIVVRVSTSVAGQRVLPAAPLTPPAAARLWDPPGALLGRSISTTLSAPLVHSERDFDWSARVRPTPLELAGLRRCCIAALKLLRPRIVRV